MLTIFLILFGAAAEFGRYFYEYTTLDKQRVRARAIWPPRQSMRRRHEGKNIVVYGNPAGTARPSSRALTTATVTSRAPAAFPRSAADRDSADFRLQVQPVFDLGKLINVPSLSMNIDFKPSVTMRLPPTQPHDLKEYKKRMIG